MLRRIVLVAILWAVAAGFAAPGALSGPPVDGGHSTELMQASSQNCGNAGLAAGTCSSPCPMGGCITAHAVPLSMTTHSAALQLPAGRVSRSGTMPETAPPKLSIV